MYNINIIECEDCQGDGYTQLHLDGKLIVEGDYYHNKITEFIEGFLFCLEALNIEHQITKEEKDICQYYCRG